MNDPNKDGATTVPAAVAPWAMKNRVGHPYTHRQDSSDGKKTTDLSLPAKIHFIVWLKKSCKLEEVPK